MDDTLHRKLDAILQKLDAIDPLQKEVERLKTALVHKVDDQENAVKRLAGNFEHLLNSQREMDTKLGHIVKSGILIQDQMRELIDTKNGNANSLNKNEVVECCGEKSKEEVNIVAETNGKVTRETREILETTKTETTKLMQTTKEQLSIEKKLTGVLKENNVTKPAETSESKGEHSTTTKKLAEFKLGDLMQNMQTVTNNNVAKTTIEGRKCYKCYSCKTFLRKRRDDPCVKCPNIMCQKWNIAGKLNPGCRWVTLANPCGHVQQVPSSKKVGESWTCTNCGKLGKIDYALKIKESEEELVDDKNMIDEVDDRHFMCGRCMEPLPTSEDRSSFFVTCPKCQNRNNLSFAFLRDIMPSKPLYNCLKCNMELQSERMEDGVSVRCDQCQTLNTAAPQRQGYRWVRLLLMKDNPRILSCEHAQQLPIDHPEFCEWRCKVCGAPGFISDCNQPATVLDVPIEDENSLIFKCNQCKTVLPKSEDTDKVRVSCPRCSNLNLVGRLQEGYKWVFLKPCKHFQQSEQYMKSGEKMKCKVCDKEGTINDVQPRWIPICETTSIPSSKSQAPDAKDEICIGICPHCKSKIRKLKFDNSGRQICPTCSRAKSIKKSGQKYMSVCMKCQKCVDEIIEGDELPPMGMCSACGQMGKIYMEGDASKKGSTLVIR